MRIALLIAVGLVAVGVVAITIGAARWRTRTAMLQQRLDAARVRIEPRSYDVRELEGLPEPVQRFFKAVLTDGQPLVAGVRLSHAGTFNMGTTSDQWKPFTSTQRVVTRRPGFVWDGRISMLPGLNVRVHDVYVAGEGVLHATLFGLITMARAEGTRELAEGELMRFFAEAAWYPTALLPSQGVTWQAADAASARATLSDGDAAITLTFRFDNEGLLRSVAADARGRTVGSAVIPTPWEGRWDEYGTRDGMRVPLRGEVAWLLPEGRQPYWRGSLQTIEFEFAG